MSHFPPRPEIHVSIFEMSFILTDGDDAIGSSLCHVIANLFMEGFEEGASNRDCYNQHSWFHNGDGTFGILLHASGRLRDLLNYLN